MNFIYDFFVEFIAAFLGFFFAIVFSGINTKYESRKKLKVIVSGIRNELQDIRKSLNDYLNNEIALRHRIATPTWDCLQFAGGVLDLIDKEYYDDLLTVYSLIKIYNEEKKDMDDKEILAQTRAIVAQSGLVLDSMEKET